MKINKTILRFRASLFMLFLLPALVFGQGIIVNGNLKDMTSGESLPGATIMEEGTSNGTTTDLDGNFTIEVTDENATLVFGFVGYLSESIQVGQKRTIDVQLSPDLQSLEEIVVVGYGVQKKSEVTGAIASVSGDDVSGMPVAKIGQAIQGKVAGVNITQNSGAPGTGLDIQIRGTGTINNSSPLYVVDGIIVDNIDHIAPENIKSLEILKDAAASAVYGARAANGVVLITTKQGESGKTKIQFSAYGAVQDYWKRPDVLNAYDFAIQDALAGRVYSEAERIINDETPEDYEKFDINWLDQISRQGVVQKYNLSISGGNEKVNYLINGNTFNNRGIILKSDFNQRSLTFDVGAKIRPWVKMRMNLLYSDYDREEVEQGDKSIIRKAIAQTPNITMYNENYPGYDIMNDHPYRTLMQNHNISGRTDIDGKLFFDFTLLENLVITTRGGIRRSTGNREIFEERNDSEVIFWDPDALNTIERRKFESTKLFWENVIRYSFTRGKHDVQMVAANSLEVRDYSRIEGEIQGALGNDLNYAYLQSGYIGDDARDNNYSWSAAGILAKFNYNYNNRYLIQFVGRADASSRFAKENRWGYFPSVALGWRVSEESFLSSADWLNMKLRATWGQNGNSRIDNYATYNTLTNNYRAVYGSENTHYIYDGVASQTTANQDIVWESTTSYNLGADLTFFRQLSLNMDVFLKRTSDMLLEVPNPPSSGMSTDPYRNTGEVENRGFEFVISYREKQTKIKYEVALNFSHYRNEVISLGESNEPVWGGDVDNPNLGYVTKTQVGHPIGEFFGYKTDGVFNTPEEIANSAQSGVAEVGDFRFIDLNRDGVIDDADRMAIGSPHPRFNGGLSIKLNYQSFDLSTFVYGVYGNSIFNVMRYYMDGHNEANMYNSVVGETWNDGSEYSHPTYYPVNTNSSLPRLNRTDNANRNYRRSSDFYVEDGSYIRLRDLQLGYTLPKQTSERLRISSFRVYAGVQNLFTITNYSGLDPEIGKQVGTEGQNLGMGIDMGNYPQSRTFFMGINIGI